MSGNLSITGSNSVSIDRISASDSSAKAKTDTKTDSSPELATMQTSKEVKKAERTGEDISLGMEQMIKAIERANKALEGKDVSMHFSIHEKTKQIMVKVVDNENGETVREFPPEKILDLVAKMMEQSGIFIDERR